VSRGTSFARDDGDMWRRGRAGVGACASAVAGLLAVASACSSESQVSVSTGSTWVTTSAAPAPPTSTVAPRPVAPDPTTSPIDADGSTGAPDGDTIVSLPGSVTIVQSGVNVTIDISECRGNGADGTATITAELSYFGGSALDRGSVNVQLLDTHGRRATVAALLVSVPPRTTVPLDFAADGTGSPARAIGEIEACWLDRVHDVSFFTAV
jgi:hypothetical protein